MKVEKLATKLAFHTRPFKFRMINAQFMKAHV